MPRKLVEGERRWKHYRRAVGAAAGFIMMQGAAMDKVVVDYDHVYDDASGWSAGQNRNLEIPGSRLRRDRNAKSRDVTTKGLRPTLTK